MKSGIFERNGIAAFFSVGAGAVLLTSALQLFATALIARSSGLGTLGELSLLTGVQQSMLLIDGGASLMVQVAKPGTQAQSDAAWLASRGHRRALYCCLSAALLVSVLVGVGTIRMALGIALLLVLIALPIVYQVKIATGWLRQNGDMTRAQVAESQLLLGPALGLVVGALLGQPIVGQGAGFLAMAICSFSVVGSGWKPMVALARDRVAPPGAVFETARKLYLVNVFTGGRDMIFRFSTVLFWGLEIGGVLGALTRVARLARAVLISGSTGLTSHFMRMDAVAARKTLLRMVFVLAGLGSLMTIVVLALSRPLIAVLLDSQIGLVEGLVVLGVLMVTSTLDAMAAPPYRYILGSRPPRSYLAVTLLGLVAIAPISLLLNQTLTDSPGLAALPILLSSVLVGGFTVRLGLRRATSSIEKEPLPAGQKK